MTSNCIPIVIGFVREHGTLLFSDIARDTSHQSHIGQKRNHTPTAPAPARTFSSLSHEIS